MQEKIVKCPICNQGSFSLFLKTGDYFLTREEFIIQQCDGCGFKFVNPRPDKGEIGRYYQSEEYISHDAKKANLFSRIYKLARVHAIKGKYGIVAGHAHAGKILDIGCGTGEFLHYCKSRGLEVTGVEPNDKAREYARKVNGIEVFNELGEAGISNPTYGCITMWHVLEHVSLLNERMQEVKRVLKDDGVLFIAVPNRISFDATHYGEFWAAFDVPRHLYHFTPETMGELIKKHGFAIVSFLPMKFDSFYVSMLSEKYKNGSSNLLKALYTGLKSNIKANSRRHDHSSMIYVIRKK